MKIKKKTMRQLNQELKVATENLVLVRQRNLEYHREVEKLKASLQARLDDRQLEQRNKLANSLGQMIEATSKAVMYIIGKEVL